MWWTRRPLPAPAAAEEESPPFPVPATRTPMARSASEAADLTTEVRPLLDILFIVLRSKCVCVWISWYVGSILCFVFVLFFLV